MADLKSTPKDGGADEWLVDHPKVPQTEEESDDSLVGDPRVRQTKAECVEYLADDPRRNFEEVA